ncbi:chemotaxis protein CheB [Notoacmeibacter ruber]|uniref:protein-glutamate methylesterase n=1 Tax=Notoacmeibacter ruber TaxID=2670375 RepID=A0A3L7JBY1_9HYPH|nr:chemotaxis protein CheB [Notoacmeibacter ruber]RLQ87929.1 chemotaxis protein CheB [Notoacmeibacter ruber]
MPKRNIIGIGGSAGALQAVCEFLSGFRPECDSVVLLVIHRTAESSRLLDILQRCTPLQVREPVDDEALAPGHIYIAPADQHLLLGDDHLHLRRGPRENNFRPSIDPLFRSLAVFAGARANGVILSGYLDDGSAGLRAIASAGGSTFVQDPRDSLTPDMPRAAISAIGEPDMIADAKGLGDHLSKIVAEEAPESKEVPENVKLELLISGLERASMKTEEKLGELSPYNCPDCNGVLWQIEDGPILRFRCHTGHAYTHAALSQRQDEMLEKTLYDSLRAHREKAQLLRQLSEREPDKSDRWLKRASEYEEDAELLEDVILRQNTPA